MTTYRGFKVNVHGAGNEWAWDVMGADGASVAHRDGWVSQGGALLAALNWIDWHLKGEPKP